MSHGGAINLESRAPGVKSSRCIVRSAPRFDYSYHRSTFSLRIFVFFHNGSERTEGAVAIGNRTNQGLSPVPIAYDNKDHVLTPK